MFGFLNINKPKGMTSFDVIYRLRKILGIKKIGHSGTLDPLATGVLPIAVGGAAKLIEYLEDDKKYIAAIKFGETSTTYDEEGEKTPVECPEFTIEELEAALEFFTGKISQIPPAYSAIKVGGKKLCDIARKGGKMPEIRPREVVIYEINLLEFTPPIVKIEVFCSKGTYIRSLTHDLGQKLGCGAYLSDLERTMAGKFEIANAIILDDTPVFINPLEVLPFSQYALNESEYAKVKNGNSIECSKFSEGEKILLSYNGTLVSIATSHNSTLKVDKVFNVC